jgi:hypothetical protein
MEILNNRQKILIDSKIRLFLLAIPIGLTSLDYHQLPLIRSKEIQDALDNKPDALELRIKNAIQVGIEKNSYQVYRENL